MQMNLSLLDVYLANEPEPSRALTPIKTTSFTKIKIDQAKQFSQKKSLGLDYALSADVTKDGGRTIIYILLFICNSVFKEYHAPTQWTSSLIVTKKEHQPKKENFQLTVEDSLTAKLNNHMIFNHIRLSIDAEEKSIQFEFEFKTIPRWRRRG